MDDRRGDICVIVPTYNNAGTLADVLRRILVHTSSVIVVDDGSTDSTAQVLEPFRGQVTVLTHAHNRGKGNALRTGLEHARKAGFLYAVTIDSDGQHFPEDLPVFFSAVAENPGALIIGSRDIQAENMPGGSTFANRFSNFWFTVQTGIRLPDTQTGYRAYPLERLPNLRLLTSRYEAELSLLVFSAWKGVKLVPVPVRVYYPPAGERVSSFRPGRDFFRISVLNTGLCLLALVYGYPRMLIEKLR